MRLFRAALVVVLAGTSLVTEQVRPVGEIEVGEGSQGGNIHSVEAHGRDLIRALRNIDSIGYRSTSVLYVDQAAAPGGDGSSWALAYQDLQQAFADAQADPTVVEIRVAEGTYWPDAATGDREAAFILIDQSNLSVLGGFPAGGGDAGSRDPANHPTVLSGDLAGDDVVTFEMLEFDSSLHPVNSATAGVHFENIGDNSLTVIDVSGADDTVILDGFTISGGHHPEQGGGLVAVGASLQLRQLVFQENSAGVQGGAVFLSAAPSPVRFDQCFFTHNSASNKGGAVYVENTKVLISEVSATENASGSGGWLYLSTNDVDAHEITDATLETNLGWVDGGAVFARSGNPVRLTDCTLRFNAAGSDGGALNLDEDNILMGCTFDANVAGHDGGSVWLSRTNEVRNCTFVNNRAAHYGGGLCAEWLVAVHGGSFTGNTAITSGGGMYLHSRGYPIENVTFERNHAGRGGALHLDSVPGSLIRACTFSSNDVTGQGGAVWARGYDSFFDCKFFDNAAETGGAVYSTNSETMTACVFLKNAATGDGGGFWGDNSNHQFLRCQFLQNRAGGSGGGARVMHVATFADSLFVGNEAGSLGGGVYARGVFGGTVATSTFVANDAADGGGINAVGPTTITDSILWDNADATSTVERAQLSGGEHVVSHCIIMGLDVYAGSSNSGANPLFVSESGPDMVPGSGDEDLRLSSASPGIDAGSISGFVTNIGPFDVYGHPRFVGFAGATATIVDMGALEAQDCNSDGRIDTESIALGLADDCNFDGVPDECQAGSFVPTSLRELIAEDPTIEGLGAAVVLRDGMLIAGAPATYYQGRPERGVCLRFDARTGEELGLLAPPEGLFGSRFGGVLAWGSQYLAVSMRSESGVVCLYDSGSLDRLREFTPPDPTSLHGFGTSVALSGSTLVAGAPGDDQDFLTDSGSAYLFDCQTGELLHKLRPLDPGYYRMFGYAADVEGDLVLIGAPGAWLVGFESPGAAYVFSKATGEQLMELGSPDPQAVDEFGLSVVLRDGRAYVSAPGQNVTDFDDGAVFVFDVHTGALITRLTSPDPFRNGYFGKSLAVSGGIIAIGADGVDGAFPDTGAIYLFDAESLDFVAKLESPEAVQWEGLGHSVACENGMVVSGARNGDSGDTVFVFTPAVLDQDHNGVPDSCPCRGDLNHDGTLDFFDAQQFLNYYSSGDLQADFVADGILDFFDLQAFLQAYSDGCP